ncbi:hypothetical protein [Microvirga sp. VF16]|uniref:hypothetical protein n=1 Tax=Microvirga sp. VF16 TaxID=2807101 RepID=UPI00193EC0FB|nr:hypothetical protein [Microvirga sp. VF16]QRM35974.1 hypothetical protein JO965_47240 [Microvirga sp. VF16]
MELDDPFPLHLFTKTVRESILDEFSGRNPSARDILSIPEHEWLKVPGMGPKTLTRMYEIIVPSGTRRENGGGNGGERWTDTELRVKFHRLADQHENIQRELAEMRPELSMIARELRLRVSRASGKYPRDHDC